MLVLLRPACTVNSHTPSSHAHVIVSRKARTAGCTRRRLLESEPVCAW